MKSQKRTTRPSLERNGPVRAWSTLFGAGANSAEGAARGVSAAPVAGVDAVQRGVEFAYRVSDEYIRQGQAFAQAFSQPFVPGSSRNGSMGALPQLTERMLRYTAELSTMWMEAVRMMPGGVGGGASPGGSTPPWPRPEARPPQPSVETGGTEPRGRLAIQIDTKLRARATLDLRGAFATSVTVAPLQLDGGAARISGVKVEREDPTAPVVVVIRIPSKQPPGTYVGRALDSETKSLVGVITVRVSR